MLNSKWIVHISGEKPTGFGKWARVRTSNGGKHDKHATTAIMMVGLGGAFIACLTTAVPVASQEVPPAWAYVANPPDFKVSPDDGTIRRIPGSNAGYTLTQLRDRFLSPDWHPGDYPPRPEIVATGRKPDVFACGFCHRADDPEARRMRT